MICTMSTYEKLAIILAGVALLWSIIYAVFNEIQKWRDRKPKITVELAVVQIPGVFSGNPRLLTITVRNKGEQLSILNSINLRLSGIEKLLFINNPRSHYSFPYELKPGDSYECWILKEDLTKKLPEIERQGKIEIKAEIGDKAGGDYKSKPFLLDLSKLD